MKLKLILALIITLATVTDVFAIENSSQLLERAAKAISTAPSVSAKYNLTVSDGSKTSGAITLSGNRFLMVNEAVRVWYDGKTQWSYLPSNQEVNINEPTAAELQQINPILIINSFKTNYTIHPSESTSTESTIILKAKKANAEIPMVSITLNKTTALPSKIAINMASGQSATISITSIAIGKKLSDASFRFPKSDYPGVEVIDLR